MCSRAIWFSVIINLVCEVRGVSVGLCDGRCWEGVLRLAILRWVRGSGFLVSFQGCALQSRPAGVPGGRRDMGRLRPVVVALWGSERDGSDGVR